MDRLDRCFMGTSESPPRLIRKSPEIDTVREHLDKADTNLAAMELMFNNKFFDWTIVTAYYAMYHATLAALLLIGLEARSHECAVLAFERFYAKKGRVDKKYLEYLERAKVLSERYAETLDKVRTWRVQASYGIGEVKSEDASFSRSQAREFLSVVKTIVLEAEGIS